MAKQGIVLKDETDASSLDGQMGRILARQLDLAGVGRLEAGDDPQNRALSRARRTEKRHELSGRHLKRDVVHGLE